MEEATDATSRRLEQSVIIVTGGASGIGGAAAQRLAREGARVVVADRDQAAGEEIVDRIRSEGGEAHFHAVDVSDEASVEKLIQATVARFGGLAGAFNNAGVAESPIPFDETDLASWQSVLAIDLTGVFLCMKHEIAYMKRHGGGAIVNTSSVAGLAHAPGRTAYTAAKHGVLGLTKQAAREFARDAIRVNAICPGLVDTPALRGSLDAAAFETLADTTAPGRIATPAEVGAVAAFLLSKDASYVSGETVVVDSGGITR